MQPFVIRMDLSHNVLLSATFTAGLIEVIWTATNSSRNGLGSPSSPEVDLAMIEVFYGYVYVAGHHDGPKRLEGIESLVSFIKRHLLSEELRITDSSDSLILHVLDGVDLFSTLHQYGVDLPQLYRSIQKQDLDEGLNGETQWDDWQEDYDRANPSPSEIRTRLAIKKAFKTAQNVADIAKLLTDGSYTICFESQDGTQAWGDFNPTDYSVVAMNETAKSGSKKKVSRVVLEPNARVRHDGSGEDIHVFILLDPPLDER